MVTGKPVLILIR